MIYPGKPQQNGRHERMHGTLKAQTCAPPAATAAEQHWFEAFQEESNFERPHEALGQRPQTQFYSASPRPFCERLDDPCYEPHELVRRVRTSGEVRWRGGLIFISEAIVGEAVGISERHDGHWMIRFADVPFALIDRHTAKLTRFGPGRPPQPQSKRQRQPSPNCQRCIWTIVSDMFPLAQFWLWNGYVVMSAARSRYVSIKAPSSSLKLHPVGPVNSP